MPKTPDVTITFEQDVWTGVMSVYDKALAFRRLPEGWRQSEYACTKASAIQATKSIKKQLENGNAAVLPYFDWTVLQGEIARLSVYGEQEEKDLTRNIYIIIDAEIKKNVEVCRLLQIIEEEDRVAARMREAQETIAISERELRLLKEEEIRLRRNKLAAMGG